MSQIASNALRSDLPSITSFKVLIETEANQLQEIRLDKLGQSLVVEAFTPVQLNLDKPKTVWVATLEIELSQLEGMRTIAIVMKASTFNSSSDVDYFITNVNSTIATPDWIVATYAQRNWVEVFYREALMMVRAT